MIDSQTFIGFSTSKKFSLISWLIQKFTKSIVSHVFFVYWDNDWQDNFVIEARENGFRLISLSNFEKENNIIVSIIPESSIEIGLRAVAIELLGSSYDYVGFFGEVVVLLGRWFKRKWNNPFRSSKTMFCSKVATLVLKKSNYKDAETLNQYNMTPQDLLEFLTKRGKNGK